MGMQVVRKVVVKVKVMVAWAVTMTAAIGLLCLRPLMGAMHLRRLTCGLMTSVLWAITSIAHAGPPVLVIASEPLTSSCRLDSNGQPGDQLDGPALVQPPTKADPAGAVYLSSIKRSDWSGSFTRYAMAAGAGGWAQATQAAWEAGALLTGSASRPPSPAAERRNLHTAIVEPDGTLAMVPFAWSALSSEQRSQLDPANDGSGPQRLAWLRGDRSEEGKLLRARSSVLGNSAHSTPVYVGQAAHKLAPARPDMLYLGANDGMLHGFNAADGAELFAYVPAALFGALHRLSSKDYAHRAYVDGPAQAGEVELSGSSRTVLVSAMGGGAQGVFALDVTDPAHFAEPGGVLWEFTDRHDGAMGNLTSLPQLAKLRVGTQGRTSVYRYFAVVPSGLNNYADDGFASPSGDGALFLLALDKPRNAPWRLNDNYFRLPAPSADPALANGLQAPVIVADRQGAARYAYAGDLQGNLWRFDLAGGQPSNQARAGAHGASLSSPSRSSPSFPPSPSLPLSQPSLSPPTALPPPSSVKLLFTARDADGMRQPITQTPQVAFADNGGYLLLFGTGKLIEQADRSTSRFAPQTYYAIRDSLHTPPDIVTGRRQLSQRVLKGNPAADRLDLEGEPMAPDNMGWYLDFLDASTTGERSLDSGVLMNGVLAFNTMLPAGDTAHPAPPAPPGDPGAACAPTHSRTYVLNVLTGLADGQSVTARLPGTPVPGPETPIVAERTTRYIPRPLLLPVAAITAPREPSGRVQIAQDFAIGLPGLQGTPAIGTVHTQKRAGRLSWREVANWRQLHQAIP